MTTSQQHTRPAYSSGAGSKACVARSRGARVAGLLMRIAVGCIACVLCGATPSFAGTTNPPMTTTTYTPTGTNIANPERGLYHHRGDCDKHAFTKTTLTDWRNKEKIGLVMCMFYLTEFKTAPISQAQLDFFAHQAAVVRDAGLKMIVRFAYTTSHAGDDATPTQVRAHLDQLAEYLHDNADVIAVMQSGFVGAFGEGYYTKHFGDAGLVNETEWKDRKDIVERLLGILPTRKVQVRTTMMKQAMYGEAATTPQDVSAGRPIARVGYHNDCFLGTYNDQGTYLSSQRDYLVKDTNLVPMGGEVCGTIEPSRGDCASVVEELGEFHFGYLNRERVPNTWQPGGCLDDVERQLGYRLSLTSVTSSPSVTRGTKLPFQMTIHNSGWASVMDHRPLHLVLRSLDTGAIHRFQIWNAKSWAPATTKSLTKQVAIPATMPAGEYEMLLSMPDPASSLAQRPAYAIRLVNSGVWQSATGFNRLLRTVEVHG
jgi:hypothetical protein